MGKKSRRTKKEKIMTINITDCGKGLTIHFYLGIDLAETVIYTNLEVCRNKLKILWNLPKEMDIKELQNYLRIHRDEILSEIKRLVNEAIK